MGSDPAMRLRTLIELLAALILTFAALAAVSKMARTTGMNVENTYARANTGAVYLTLNDAESEPNRLCCTATDAARCAAGIDSPYSDA
jgi:copper(I)-binding protein